MKICKILCEGRRLKSMWNDMSDTLKECDTHRNLFESEKQDFYIHVTNLFQFKFTYPMDAPMLFSGRVHIFCLNFNTEFVIKRSRLKSQIIE